MRFTGRHERDLAEIKGLVQDLDRRSREALDHLVRIHKAYGSESVREPTGDEISALVTRYGLNERAADALQGLGRLVDWDRANFLPRSAGRGPEPKKRHRRTPAPRIASTTLAESLFGLKLEPLRTARRVADLGSGAGFPGLVLAIALPGARFHLIERVHGRCEFLRRAATELELENVEVVEGDIHQWSEGRGSCDVVTSRKLGRLKTMVGWCAPLLAPGGSVALWPGPTDFAEEEVAAAGEAADAADLRLAQILPIESENRWGQPVVKHLYRYEKGSAADARAR
jgi:16S rRNA (guanine527-N7)-methyltransferase